MAEEVLANLRANIEDPDASDRARFEASLRLEIPEGLVEADPRLSVDGKFVDP